MSGEQRSGKAAVGVVLALLVLILYLTGCQGQTDWYRQGMEYLRQEKYEKALSMFDKAIAENGANYDAWLARGDALFYLDRYFDSVRSFEQAPWSKIGSHKEAKEAVDKALEADPGDASLWALKGDYLRQKSGQAEALACYEKALEINPKNFSAWWGKYYSLVEEGRLQEAEVWRNQGIDAGVL